MSLEVPPVILASASPRRRDLLYSVGIDCFIQPTDVDEIALESQFTGPPEGLAVHLAEHKVRAAAEMITTPAIIIAADTTVIIDNVILGKPTDATVAQAMLQQLRGRTHHVVTGIAMLATATATVTLKTKTTPVTMRDYTDAEIAAYIATGDPFDKAGSYAVQHPNFQPVARIDGCATNVIGLPLCLLLAELRPYGVVPTRKPNADGICQWNNRCSQQPSLSE